MPSFKEEHEHFRHMATQFRRLASRTDQARRTAIGWSDFGPGVAHDPQLNEQIDWFYRRWVQRVEIARGCLLSAADQLEAGMMTYRSADEKVRSAAEQQSGRRVGADL